MREQEGDSKLPWEREGRAEEWYLRRGGLSIAKEEWNGYEMQMEEGNWMASGAFRVGYEEE